MIDVLISVVLGSFIGIIVGVLPGLGATALLLMVYPLLQYFDLLSLFVFYFALINSSQYYGSVSATVYGVAGELSSIPAVKHGHALFLDGHGSEALVRAATASFIAALFAITLFVLLANTDIFSYFMKSSWRMSMMILALLSMIFFSGKKITAVLFVVLGLVIGKIGYDHILQTRILTFGMLDLDGGLPFFPVFAGLVLIPSLIEGYTKSKFIKFTFVPTDFLTRLKLLFDQQYMLPNMRGAVIGFFSGLIPGVSYTISSSIAEWIENKIRKTHNQRTHQLNAVVAAEAANNSAAVSVLIPLITLAIPIVSSEAIVLSIAETKGFGINVSLELLTNNLMLFVGALLIINVLNWIVAGLLFNQVIKIYQCLQKYIYHIVIVLCTLIMLYFAWTDYQLWLSLPVFALFLIFGLLVKDLQAKTSFVFAYFVADLLSYEIYFYIL